MLATRRALSTSTPQAIRRPSLIGGARVDVCVVGAGVAGLIAAYLLAREGRSVIVVDEGPAGGRTAGSATVKLAAMIEPPYASLEREHGAKSARLAAKSFRSAVDTIEAIVRRERIACDFERLDGYCLGEDSARAFLEHETGAARRAGLAGVEMLDAPPIAGAVAEPCVRYPGQAQVHPQKFLEGLARATAHAGGRLHFGVALKSLEPGRPAAVVTSFGHRIEAEAIVMPGRRPIVRDVEPAMHALALRVPRGSLTRALYWDSARPQCCARLRTTGPGGGEHLLVMGDLDHRELEAWARAHFPMCGEVLQRLEGEPASGSDLFVRIGHEGAAADGVYVGTAGWGSAMTRAAVAAITVKDFVQATYFERDYALVRM